MRERYIMKRMALACVVVACVGAREAFGGLLYEPSNYAAQDNIVVNFDGIRNAGLLKAHNSNATEWKNIGRAANDAEFFKKEGDASAWVADGYHFAGGAYGKLKFKQNLGANMTVQIVCDAKGSENSTSWPTFFGCPEDWANIYYSNPSSEILHFKADAITGLSYNTGRSVLNNWSGRYLNAALDSSAHKQILVQSDSFQTGWKEGSGGTQSAPGRLNWYFGSCGSSQSALDARYLVGTIKAIRVYNKVLSNTELAANRVIDEARFFNGIPVTNVVIATAVAGLEGNEGSDVYAYDDAGYTFTAPQKATKDGTVYACAGYTLETWNGSTWSAPVSYASCAYAATDTSAKVRLTWQWQRAHAELPVALDPLFDDYVTDGLILHIDGIRNVGADKPHSWTSPQWHDLVSGSNVASFQHDEGDASTWLDDGYYFGGRSFAQFVNSISSLTNTVTVQIVCDTTTNALMKFKTSVPGRNILWPNMIGTGDNDKLNVYYDQNNSNRRLTFKNANGGNANNGNDKWEGRYATAIRNGTMNYITQTASIADAGTAAAASGNIGSEIVRIGSAGTSLATRNQRWFLGTIKAVRVYDRVLSDAELEQNREIDEARFFGGPLPVTNVVVASSVRGVNGNEPEGTYTLPAGGHTFSAPATVTVGDNTYSCTGYKLEAWNDATGTWSDPVSYESSAYNATDTTAKVRLTWQWTHTAGPGYDAAFSDYATDGLVVHLDGIRNMGLASVHDSSAVTWADLSDIGGCAQFVHASTDGSAWMTDGYRFGGKSYAVMDGLRTLDTAFTIQIVSEVDTYANCRMSTTWPALLGTTAASGDPLPIYMNNNNNNNSAVNCKVGNSNIGIYITNWAGEYATAWSDGVNAGFFDTVTPASKTAFAHSAGTRTITIGSGNGGSNGYAVRNLLGAIKAVRIYNRALTDAELAQNRAADEARFFARAPTAATGEVIVRSNVEGLSGNQPNGMYRLAGSYSFTAPSEAVVNGTLYECTGYTLETWDGSAWGSSVSYEVCTYSADVSAASRRLTWNWRIASRLTKIRDDYDVDDYVQDGLYLHLDGIRNAGKTADHDGTAEAWTNLVSGGASLDAVFDYANNASAGDGWTANGYEFVYGGKFARLSANPNFGNSVTIQTVGRFNGGTSSYPSLFGSTNDFCNVYTFTAGGEAYFKVFNTTRTDVLPAKSWEGKYITAIWHKGKYAAFQYAAPERSAWNGTWNKNTTEFKSAPFYVGGIFKEGDSSYTNDRRYTGTIHAIRVYKRVLTDEELQQNREVDEARFFGNPPESNVVVVDAGGEQSESGTYKVEGTWTFTAATARGDNNEIKPVKGYTLDTWNGSAWIRTGSGRGDSYTYTVGTSPAKVRLTWNALPSGTVLIVR